MKELPNPKHFWITFLLPTFSEKKTFWQIIWKKLVLPNIRPSLSTELNENRKYEVTSGAWTIGTKGPWPPSKFGPRKKRQYSPLDKFFWPLSWAKEGTLDFFSTGPPSLANLQAPLEVTTEKLLLFSCISSTFVVASLWKTSAVGEISGGGLKIHKTHIKLGLRMNGLALIVWFTITELFFSTTFPWFATRCSLLTQKNIRAERL